MLYHPWSSKLPICRAQLLFKSRRFLLSLCRNRFNPANLRNNLTRTHNPPTNKLKSSCSTALYYTLECAHGSCNVCCPYRSSSPLSSTISIVSLLLSVAKAVKFSLKSFAALFLLRYSRCSALFARLDLAHGYLYLAFGLPSWKGT